MKYLLILALIATNSNAAIKGAPFQPEIDNRFDLLERDALEGAAIAQKYLRATYDVSVDGGASTSARALGVYLPAKAVVTDFQLFIDTQFADSAANGSVQFYCEDQQNLMSYQDITGYAAGNLINLGANAKASVGTLVKSIAAQCEVNASVFPGSGGGEPSAGKATALIKYFIQD